MNTQRAPLYVLSHLARYGKAGESAVPEDVKVPEIVCGQALVESVHVLSGSRVYWPWKLTFGIGVPYTLVASRVTLQNTFLLVTAQYTAMESCRQGAG